MKKLLTVLLFTMAFILTGCPENNQCIGPLVMPEGTQTGSTVVRADGNYTSGKPFCMINSGASTSDCGHWISSGIVASSGSPLAITSQGLISYWLPGTSSITINAANLSTGAAIASVSAGDLVYITLSGGPLTCSTNSSATIPINNLAVGTEYPIVTSTSAGNYFLAFKAASSGAVQINYNGTIPSCSGNWNGSITGNVGIALDRQVLTQCTNMTNMNNATCSTTSGCACTSSSCMPTCSLTFNNMGTVSYNNAAFSLAMYIGNFDPNTLETVVLGVDVAWSPYVQGFCESIGNSCTAVNGSSGDQVCCLTTGQFVGNSPTNGVIWFLLPDTNYTDNTGCSTVNITATSTSGGQYNNTITSMIKPIKTALQASIQGIYTTAASNDGLRVIVLLLLTLYICFWGILYALGMVEVTQMDFVKRIAKIGIVLALISDNSWNFFNGVFFSAFTGATDQLIGIVTGGSVDAPFTFVDNSLGLFLQKSTWIKLGAMLSVEVFGIVYFILMFVGLYSFLCVIFQAVISYMIALIAETFILSLAPIFIPFMLFKPTFSMFMKWVKALAYFAIFPVLMFCAINLINELIVISLYGVMSFAVCWDCVLPVLGGNCTYWWSAMPGVLSSGNVEAGSALNQISILFPRIIMFVLFNDLLVKSLDLIPGVMDRMMDMASSQGFKLTGEGSISKKAIEGIRSPGGDK